MSDKREEISQENSRVMSDLAPGFRGTQSDARTALFEAWCRCVESLPECLRGDGPVTSCLGAIRHAARFGAADRHARELVCLAGEVAALAARDHLNQAESTPQGERGHPGSLALSYACAAASGVASMWLGNDDMTGTVDSLGGAAYYSVEEPEAMAARKALFNRCGEILSAIIQEPVSQPDGTSGE